jgi:hypothetical protein
MGVEAFTCYAETFMRFMISLDCERKRKTKRKNIKSEHDVIE